MNNDRGYVLHKSRQSAEAALSNLLTRAPELPYALGARSGQRVGTAVVVGAGPSLADTVRYLPQLIEDGATVFTVNTALPLVAQHCEPDVVIAREIVDVSQHMRHRAWLRVLDLGAHPRVWEAAMREGPCAWFIPGADQYFALSYAVGARPLFGGQAALTSAVALAEEWGAARIVLLGADLATADDGRSYADGSAFSGQRATIGADGMAENGGEGFAVKQAAHAAAGIKGWPEREITTVVERWGGGSLRTTTQWIDQIGWLANFAARHPDIQCIDATGAGARKPMWIEQRVERAHGAGQTMAMPMTKLDPEALRSRARVHLAGQVELIDTLAANVSTPGGSPLAIPGLFAGVDFVELMAARDVTTSCEGPGTTMEKIAAVYGEHGAFVEAARRVAEMLG